jgi:hypothetical protein
MRQTSILWMATMALAMLGLNSPAYAARNAEDEFARIIKAIQGRTFVTDWRGIEKLPNFRWAPLPPAMLQNCLPDGGCFTRVGTARIGGRDLVVVATGARTFVNNIYFRNRTVPFGEDAILGALRRAGILTELARCPAKAGIAGTNWYRLKGADMNPGYLSIQSSCNGKPCEGFVLSQGDDLPPLQPKQLRLYSEQCAAAGTDRKPVSTVMPYEELAQMMMMLLPQATGPALYDWKALTSLPTAIKWHPDGAKARDLSYMGDPNPWMHQGQVNFSGRQIGVIVSGSPTHVKTIYLEEGGLHPRGEDLMAYLRAHGFSVKLAHCGPIYTQSINNWYSVTSPKTRPIMLRQSMRLDGKLVQDTYEMRLDDSQPKHDPRDREPGAMGCR